MAKPIPFYLVLPMEHGGTRFGPFTKRIEIGSDPKRNQIALDSRHGIFPNHAYGMQNEPGVLTLQPAGPQCQLFLIPHGQQQPWPVRSPVQVRSGDLIIFGTPAGPRFFMWIDPELLKSTDQLMAEARAKGGDAGVVHAIGGAMDKVMGAPKSGGIGGEIARRGQAELLTSGPGRTVYQLWTRAKTGALFSPRNVVAMLVAVGGLLASGGLTCSGVLYAFWRTVIQ